jgi:hypothetical protein
VNFRKDKVEHNNIVDQIWCVRTADPEVADIFSREIRLRLP